MAVRSVQIGLQEEGWLRASGCPRHTPDTAGEARRVLHKGAVPGRIRCVSNQYTSVSVYPEGSQRAGQAELEGLLASAAPWRRSRLAASHERCTRRGSCWALAGRGAGERRRRCTEPGARRLLWEGREALQMAMCGQCAPSPRHRWLGVWCTLRRCRRPLALRKELQLHARRTLPTMHQLPAIAAY